MYAPISAEHHFRYQYHMLFCLLPGRQRRLCYVVIASTNARFNSANMKIRHSTSYFHFLASQPIHLTPWNRNLREKLIVAEVVKKFPELRNPKFRYHFHKTQPLDPSRAHTLFNENPFCYYPHICALVSQVIRLFGFVD
jgi:hypothetical protein